MFGYVIEKIIGIFYYIYIYDVINKVGDIDLLVYEGDEFYRLYLNEVIDFSYIYIYILIGICNRKFIKVIGIKN